MELECGLASEVRRDKEGKESELAFFRFWESFQVSDAPNEGPE